jgi:chromosomal replication initiation ATPase DnaA
MAQLAFSWASDAAYHPEDFIPSACNEAALSLADNWPDAGVASHVALICGAEQTGKTHLAHRWAARHQARFLDKTGLGLPSQVVWDGAAACVLEDIEPSGNETALFHLIRHAESHPVYLLLTSRFPPAAWEGVLPDLSSRLMAMPGAQLQPPDDALMEAFLLKRFSDRQLRVEADVTRYLARRLERSLKAAQECVRQVELYIFETKRELTIPAVRSLFAFE